MQFGTYGVFQGGEVTLNTVQAGIDVSSMTLRTADGRNMGFGAPGRKVIVQFGQPVSPFAFSAIRPSPLDVPIHTLRISADAGEAYIAFDATVSNDIAVIAAPTTGFIILAKVSWPANTTAISQLDLSLADRQVSRLLSSRNPLSPTDLYTAGMRFGDTEFNKPLIAFSVLSEVLQGEAVAKNSDEFSFVVANHADVVGAGTTLTVHPIKAVLRRRVTGDAFYTVIETKSDFVFSFSLPDVMGDRIYIWINPASGEVGAGLSYTPSTGVLVGYGDVPFGITGLQDVRWILAAQVADANAQSGTSVTIQDMTLPSGFVRPVEVTTSTAVQKYLLLHGNVAIIKGVEYRIQEQPLALPDAPLTGERLDLIFAEFYRRVEPSPPTSGEFFQNVPGVGFVVARTRLAIIPDVTYADAQALLLQPAVTGLGGGTFVREASGHFASAYADAADGMSYALPLALVSRFNQAPFAETNHSGGGLAGGGASTRPDGKRHNFIHIDEVELPGPVLAQHGLNHSAVFGRVLQHLLRGTHPNKLGTSTQVPSHRSKRPLQLDAISPTAIAGVNVLSAPDGVRREWTAAPQPYWVGTNFMVNLDATSALHSYEDGTRALTITAPLGANLFLGGAGGTQPVVQLTWVETGLPVQLTGPWTLGTDALSAVGVLDAAAPSFAPADRVAVSFAVIQRPEQFLGNMPAQLLGATLNGAPLRVAVPGPEQPFMLAGRPAIVRPVGNPDNGSATTATFVAVADGSSQVVVPAALGGFDVLGVRDAEVVSSSAALGIRSVQLGSPDHAVVLSAAVAAGEDVRLTLLVSGKSCNLEPANRAVTDFAEAAWHGVVVLGERTNYNLALPAGRVLRGVYTFVRTAGAAPVQGVFVDGFLYPATVTGFDRNFVQVNLTLTPADHAALPVAQQGKWQLDALNGYYLLNPGSYTLQLALTWSAAPAPADQVKFTYAFSALPFAPIQGGENFELLHRGFVVASNSSIANRSPNYFAPLAERLPLVRGSVLGLNAPSPETVFNDPTLLEMQGVLPVEGTRFFIDGAVNFGLGVGAPAAGFLAWLCLVKDGHNLKFLVYITQDNAFSISNPNKAFVSYCDANFVE